MSIRNILAGLAGAALFAGMAAAQTTESAHRLRSTDVTFLNKAAAGGLAEVELGQLALSKATNQKVKQFAQQMVDDHTRLNNDLKSVAEKKGVTPPTTMTGKYEKTKDELSKKSGDDFDRAYMKQMVEDHREDVSEFKKESENGPDPDVKAAAKKALPTLEEHLRMAEQTEGSLTGKQTGR